MIVVVMEVTAAAEGWCNNNINAKFRKKRECRRDCDEIVDGRMKLAAGIFHSWGLPSIHEPDFRKFLSADLLFSLVGLPTLTSSFSLLLPLSLSTPNEEEGQKKNGIARSTAQLHWAQTSSLQRLSRNCLLPVRGRGIESIRLPSERGPFQGQPQLSENPRRVELSTTSFCQFRCQPLEYRLRPWSSAQFEVDGFQSPVLSRFLFLALEEKPLNLAAPSTLSITVGGPANATRPFQESWPTTSTFALCMSAPCLSLCCSDNPGAISLLAVAPFGRGLSPSWFQHHVRSQPGKMLVQSCSVSTRVCAQG